MNNQADSPLTQLKKAIVAQKSAALPDTAPDPKLQPLHESVVLYDQYVSQAVIAILGGGNQAAPYPQREEIRRHLQETESTNPSNPAVRVYSNYLTRLDHMLALAVEVSESRK